MKQQRMMGEQDVVDALRFGKELPHLKDQFELLVEEINSLEDKRNSLRAAISALQNRISADCGRGNGLILKVRVSGPDLACDAIDLVSAAEYILRRIVKRAIFVVDLVATPSASSYDTAKSKTEIHLRERAAWLQGYLPFQ
jgi:hypothetical protein